MAKSQPKNVTFMNTYSPIKENDEGGGGGGDDYEEAASASGCGCFRLFCFGRKQRDEGESNSYLLQGRGVHKEAWFVKNLNKLKEFSEVVAGPKWKNFIRKIGKFCNTRKAKCQFQYSAESYALNFDGVVDHEEEDSNFVHSFSARFAPRAFSDQQTRTGS